MSTAAIAEHNLPFERVQAPVRVALRNLLLTFALAVSSLAVAGWLNGKAGYEMLIVIMGWPHVILGFIFYFGKVLRGERLARSSFVLLGLLTLALWTAHYSWAITGFISVYFTYHVFRDEVFIYHQTRARHRLRSAVKVAGFIPFILLMFIATDPRPQHYRQDLRRAELTSAQMNENGWTLFSFVPISYSADKEFYFYIEAPLAKGASGYTTLASVSESRTDGEIRLSDRRWAEASDLVFRPQYSDEKSFAPDTSVSSNETMTMRLTGDYRLGQTFRAERDNLSGIWLPTRLAGDAPVDRADRFVFHLTPDTSLPLPPLSRTLNLLRYLLMAVLAGLVLWKALPEFKRTRAFWIYFVILVGIFALLQKAIMAMGGSGFELPVMFQLVVVFHYWSWYVFSFDKLGAMQGTQQAPRTATRLYDRMLASLGSVKNFALLVIFLNLVSAAFVLWFSRFNGPAALRFVFDYHYFLYFLVFHVTFSFGPKQPSRKVAAPAQGAAVASPA